MHRRRRDIVIAGLAARRNLLRPREGHGTAPVTQIELFFDLVFVFAVTQLSLTLRMQLNPLGLLHIFILFGAVWWLWVYTSWITNWLDPDQRPVRLMLIIIMLGALAMAACLPAAFGARELPFAVAFVFMQASRSLFMLWAVRRFDAANFRNFQRILAWTSLSGGFWVAGGLQALEPRTLCWLAALMLDLLGPACGFRVPGLGRSTTEEWRIDSFHLAERCAGFILIALGESITVTGAAFYQLHWTMQSETAFATAFLGAVTMWWIYFDSAAEHTSAAFAASDNPGRVARAAYTYVHAILVAGIIVVAVADEVVINHPAGAASLADGLAILGGPVLYLAGNALLRRMLAPRFPPSHIFGLASLGLLAVAAPFLPMLALAGLATLTLVAVAAIGSILYHRQISK